ncbi:hypothetical protein ALO46_102888 [Pseudomonas syringae pv. solidagae]|nr:hypothetical protein ALO46_102888 [Pseudomonas syringae pv. solidagae]
MGRQRTGFGQRHLGLRVGLLKGLQRRERLSADQQQALRRTAIEQGGQRLLGRTVRVADGHRKSSD